MWPFTDARQERINSLVAENRELEVENRALTNTNKELVAEVAQTGVLLTAARDGRDIAYRQNAHLIAERDKLADELAAANARLARFTGPRQRGEHGRFVKASVSGSAAPTH